MRFNVPTNIGLGILSAIVLAGALLASAGFFSVDEAIYHLGGRAIAEGHALGIGNNGYGQFHSDALKLVLLVDGPQGLTPQYPAGASLLAAPLLPLLGARAFILLNAIAAALMLFTVRKICLSQFRSERVAWIALALLAAGTFWMEYAHAIWPHMLSAYLAVQALWFALRHLESDERSTRDALLSGLFAGAGMLFRLDAVLAVAAIGVIMVVFAPRLLHSASWFAAGVLPSLALASWLNWLKFGSPNPFSYGRSGGNADLSAHMPFVVAACLGVGGLLLWRKAGWRIDRKVVIAALAFLGAAMLVIPATNALLLRLWNGFLVLVVDMRSIEDQRNQVRPGPGDTRLFWNFAKKALGQSMPWIGLTAMLLTSGIRKDERRIMGSLLIFIATMTMPFILLSWHGGSGSNMRYFLPVLPVLCIICAKLVSDLWSSVPNAAFFAAAGVWGAIALSLGWAFLHPSGNAGVQQILSTYVLLAMVLAAIAAGPTWKFQQPGRQLAVALFGSGVFLSMAAALSDYQLTQFRRSEARGVQEALAALPAKSLVITFPEWAVDRLPGNGSMLATRDPQTRRTDAKLIFDALDADYRVFMDSFKFDPSRSVPPGIDATLTRYAYPKGRFIELRRWGDPPPAD